MTDVFRAAGGVWRVSWGGTSRWEEINQSSVGLDNLVFGDFNGDGKTDVFRAAGGVWRVSWGGTSRWEEINQSSVGLDNLAFGDFDGDGKTDVFSSMPFWSSTVDLPGPDPTRPRQASVSQLRRGRSAVC